MIGRRGFLKTLGGIASVFGLSKTSKSKEYEVGWDPAKSVDTQTVTVCTKRSVSPTFYAEEREAEKHLQAQLDEYEKRIYDTMLHPPGLYKLYVDWGEVEIGDPLYCRGDGILCTTSRFQIDQPVGIAMEKGKVGEPVTVQILGNIDYETERAFQENWSITGRSWDRESYCE